MCLSLNTSFPSQSHRGLREQAALEGREPKQLAYTKPQDDLSKVAALLSAHKCSMSPVLSCDPTGGGEVSGVGMPVQGGMIGGEVSGPAGLGLIAGWVNHSREKRRLFIVRDS